jgi:hypothetical protein
MPSIQVRSVTQTERLGASRWFVRLTFSPMFSSCVRHARLAPCGSVVLKRIPLAQQLDNGGNFVRLILVGQGRFPLDEKGVKYRSRGYFLPDCRIIVVAGASGTAGPVAGSLRYIRASFCKSY